MIDDIVTIGYGNRTLDAFLAILRNFSIQVICDVRSTPYSSRYPDYNRETLKVSLKSAGIQYLFLGESLGARPSDPSLYVSGKASYEAMARSSAFQGGLERLTIGRQRYRVALMCAEKEPLDCHRAILIGRALSSAGITVSHIGPDDRLELHRDLEKRMLRRYGFHQTTLLEARSESVLLASAYEERGKELAYDVNAPSRARISS